MARQVQRRGQSRKVGSSRIAFTKRNYQLFGLAILVLLIGYWALAQAPVNGFLTLTLAPILLVIGYCVLIPYAIIYSGPKSQD